MDDKRHTAPGTPLHEVGITAVYAGPKAVLTRIRIAVAGVILYAAYSVGRALIDPHEQKFLVLLLVSPVVMLALASGMNLKSRICALLLLAYALMPRVSIYLKTGTLVWTAAWTMLICACCLGVFATFEYHLLRRCAEAAS